MQQVSHTRKSGVAAHTETRVGIQLVRGRDADNNVLLCHAQHELEQQKTMILILDLRTALLLLVRLELLALDSVLVGNLLPAQQMN